MVASRSIEADHTKDHDRVRELGLHHSGHIAIHRWFCLLWAWVWQKFFSSEKNHSMLDSFGCFRLLRSLVELSSLLSVLGCLGQKLASLHPVVFAVQILIYTSLICPFIKPSSTAIDLMNLERLMLIMASTLLTKSASLDFQRSSRDFGPLVITPWGSLLYSNFLQIRWMVLILTPRLLAMVLLSTSPLL